MAGESGAFFPGHHKRASGAEGASLVMERAKPVDLSGGIHPVEHCAEFGIEAIQCPSCHFAGAESRGRPAGIGGLSGGISSCPRHAAKPSTRPPGKYSFLTIKTKEAEGGGFQQALKARGAYDPLTAQKPLSRAFGPISRVGFSDEWNFRSILGPFPCVWAMVHIPPFQQTVVFTQVPSKRNQGFAKPFLLSR